MIGRGSVLCLFLTLLAISLLAQPAQSDQNEIDFIRDSSRDVFLTLTNRHRTTGRFVAQQ